MTWDNSKLLIGSRAILHHFKDFPRDCKDWDFVVDDFFTDKSTKEIEYHKIPVLLERGIISKNRLFTLKCSHLLWDINFAKHLYDFKFMLQKGCILDRDLLHQLVEFWKSVHGVKRITNFDKTPDEFFKDKIKRKFNHDDLHKTFAFYNEPLYLKLVDKTVEPIQSRFELLDYEDQLKVVMEEAFVIAYERYVEPLNCPYKVAFQKALKDLITRLFPEWLAIFTLENYIELENRLFDFTKLTKEC